MDSERATAELTGFLQGAAGRPWTDAEAERVDELAEHVRVDPVAFGRGLMRTFADAIRERDARFDLLENRVAQLESGRKATARRRSARRRT